MTEVFAVLPLVLAAPVSAKPFLVVLSCCLCASALTPGQVADHWNCAIETVLRLIRSGRLRAFSLSPPGSKRPRWRVSPDALVEFENRNAVVPRSKATKRQRRQSDVIEFFS